MSTVDIWFTVDKSNITFVSGCHRSHQLIRHVCIFSTDICSTVQLLLEVFIVLIYVFIIWLFAVISVCDAV